MEQKYKKLEDLKLGDLIYFAKETTVTSRKVIKVIIDTRGIEIFDDSGYTWSSNTPSASKAFYSKHDDVVVYSDIRSAYTASEKMAEKRLSILNKNLSDMFKLVSDASETLRQISIEKEKQFNK